MATDSAIADVGETLVRMLADRMDGLLDDDEIVLGSPGDENAGEDFRLTLYLYDVRESEHLSNDRRRPPSTGRSAGAALVLDLHYLLTAHPKSRGRNETRTSRSAEQHTVLGRAMRIMADNAIVRKPDLAENLDPSETITISLESRPRAELLDIWGTFSDVTYQPSVSYVVSPVVIDSSRSPDTPRVLEATFNEFTYASADNANGGTDR